MDLSLSQLMAQVGMSGVFLFLFWQTRKEFLEARKDFAEQMKLKDSYIEKLNDKLVQIVENNTKVTTEVVSAVANNTESTDRLTETVNLVLRK